MGKTIRKWLAIWVVIVLSFGTTTIALAAEEETTITILETSDLHGMIYNYDYAADTETNYGLAKIATIIKEERKKDENLLLVDCGDTLQGNLLGNFRNEKIHPGIEAMNLLKYDTWTLGNHEFDYEFESLEKAIQQSNAKVLSGNIYKEDGTRFVEPYTIMEVKGVKVAFFGLTSPYVTRWVSDPSKYNNMTFTNPMEETDKILQELEGKADVIIGVVHIGEEGEQEKDGMDQIALNYADKIDALLIGHSHAQVAKSLVNNKFQTENSSDSELVIIEPGANGTSIGKCTLNLKKKNGEWEVINRSAELISTAETKADEELKEAMHSLHENSLAEANQVIGKIGADFYEELYLLPGIPNGLIEDHALADLINMVQLKESGADVSMAALFSPDANLEKGEFKFKDGVKVYKYDNTLYAVKVTGAQLKKIMEAQTGALYNTYKTGDVTISFHPDFRLYKYDMFAGIDYNINISKPVGQRIEQITYKGKPLKEEQTLILALNDYRWSSLVSEGLIEKDAVVYSSLESSEYPAIRDMIANYVKEQGIIYPSCDNNWKITGADLEDEQKELIYEMVREGSLSIPASEDGRDLNIASLNAIELREQGVLPALDKKEENKKEEIEKENQEQKEEQEQKDKKTEQENQETISKEKINYTVVAGDNLYRIAKKHRCTISEIATLNKISNIHIIWIGQKLVLPVK